MKKQILHKVGYNSQRNNLDFSGKFKGFRQCFSTSAHMFMSFYSKAIDAANDEQLARYLDQVEASVGTRGIAEKVIRSIPGIPVTGSSFWWKVQVEGINYVLSKHQEEGHVSVKGRAEWVDFGTFDEFDRALLDGPVIVGTNKMGGLAGGHIVLAIGLDPGKRIYYLNDPYGNPLSNYRDSRGEGVAVPADWFRIQCSKATMGDHVRFIYWKKDIS